MPDSFQNADVLEQGLSPGHCSHLGADCLLWGASWALGLSSIPGPARMVPGALPVMTTTGFPDISCVPWGQAVPQVQTLSWSFS